MTPQGYPLVIKDEAEKTWLVIGWDARNPVCIPANPAVAAQSGWTIIRGSFSICSYGMDRRA